MPPVRADPGPADRRAHRNELSADPLGYGYKGAKYADAVAGLPVRLLDTRKTLPGLRVQQKYAVLCGGCHNHRIGLFDAILIKENHILAAGSIGAALRAAFAVADGVQVEIEVESLDEMRQALCGGGYPHAAG